MLQNLLASIGMLAIVVVAFARMTSQEGRPVGQRAGSRHPRTPRRRRPFWPARAAHPKF